MSKLSSYSIGSSTMRHRFLPDVGNSTRNVLFSAAILALVMPSAAVGNNLLNVNLCEKLNQRTNRVAIKPVAKPPYLRLFNEPGFGSKVMRISNGSLGTATKPGHSSAQAWNADESRLILHRYDSQGVHSALLLNGYTYEEIGRLRLPSLASESIYWSKQDPNILFYLPDTEDEAGKLSQLNIANGEKTVIKDFSPHCKKYGLSAQGGQLLPPTIDDDLFGFRCGVSNQKSLAVSYQRSTDKLSTLKTGKGTPWSGSGAPQPLSAENLFLLDGKILNQNLRKSKKNLDIADNLAPYSVGSSIDAQDMFFQSATKRSPRNCKNDIWNGIGLLVRHNISDGSCKSIVTQTKGYPETPPGTKIAANAYQNPKWLAMTSQGENDADWFTKKRGAPLLSSEVVLFDTSEDESAPCRLAHHRSFGNQSTNATYEPTLGQPIVSLSPQATRVLFSSDWYDSGVVDTYVVVLPAYTRLELTGDWVDVGNSAIKTVFTQHGETISFQRTLPGIQDGQTTLVTGKGEISGEKIELRYNYSLDADRVVNGTCTGDQSDDRSTISLICLNDYYGYNTEFTLERPE